MKKIIFFLVSFLFAINFPPLTGRVVDNANILSPNTKQILKKKLKEFENNTSNQVVVVTLKSLQGHSIEEYGYKLGRYWGIGQKDKNNGVLLIVAPNERKVRIEVGYGLEGYLTDAKSFEIIHDFIIPYFKKGDYDTGVIKGVNEILKTIKNTYKPKKNKKNDDYIPYIFGFLFFTILISNILKFLKPLLPAIFISSFAFIIINSFFDSFIIALIAAIILFFIVALFFKSKNSSSTPIIDNYNNDFDSNNDFSGGFNGGGGSFGGGGSSGSW
jgi:uncharacterized protein